MRRRAPAETGRGNRCGQASRPNSTNIAICASQVDGIEKRNDRCARPHARDCRRSDRRDRRRESRRRGSTGRGRTSRERRWRTNGACRPCGSSTPIEHEHDRRTADDADASCPERPRGSAPARYRWPDFWPCSRISTSTMVEEHGERIVGAGLHLDASPPRAGAARRPRACIRKNTAAASVEATAAPSSKPSAPAQMEQIDGGRGDQRRGHEHAERRQRTRGRQHAAKSREPRAQTAVEQDQRQRDRADR